MRSEAKRPQVDEAAPRWLRRLIRYSEPRVESKFFPNEIQIQPNPGLVKQIPAKLKQTNSSLSFAEFEPFQGLTPTPGAFFVFEPLPASGGHGRRWCCPFACLSVSLVFVSRSSGLFEQGEGLAPFLTADAWASFVRLVGRGADEREEGTGVHGAKAPGAAEKTGRSIRRPARIHPFHQEPEPVSSLGQADGRQPFCLGVSHDPCL